MPGNILTAISRITPPTPDPLAKLQAKLEVNVPGRPTDTCACRQRILLILGSGVDTQCRRHGAGRILEVVYADAADLLLTFQYLHDKAANPRIRSDLKPGVGTSESSGHNSPSRHIDVHDVPTRPPLDPTALALTGARIPDLVCDSQAEIDALIGPIGPYAGATTFSCNPVGNRLAEQISGGSLPYQIDDLDQNASHRASSSAYDGNGNCGYSAGPYRKPPIHRDVQLSAAGNPVDDRHTHQQRDLRPVRCPHCRSSQVPALAEDRCCWRFVHPRHGRATSGRSGDAPSSPRPGDQGSARGAPSSSGQLT